MACSVLNFINNTSAVCNADKTENICFAIQKHTTKNKEHQKGLFFNNERKKLSLYTGKLVQKTT